MSSESAFTFLPLGAIIQEFTVAGRNIVLRFPKEEHYRRHNAPYFGETIGRVANRVSNARIEKLNGKSYDGLSANEGRHSLHGGESGWGKHEFEGPEQVNRNGKEGVMFRYLSRDGDGGYPGTVELKVWYTAWTDKGQGADKTTLEVEYEAELVGNEVEETVVSVTNHSYFNIGDGPTIEGTEVTLPSTLHQVVDSENIPTGDITSYPNIAPDKPFTLGAHEPAIDHCIVVNPDPASIPIDSRSVPLRTLGTFYHPSTRLHLQIQSTEPAFQLYTGEGIETPAVEGQAAYGPRAGFAVEPSRYVNAVNRDEWRNMVVLPREKKYGSRSVYQAWKE